MEIKNMSKTENKKMKKCPRCNQYKAEHEFPHETQRGRYPYCKPCKASYMRERRKRIPVHVRNLERRLYLKKIYGITMEQYEEIYKAQNGGCAICGVSKSAMSGSHIFLAVDHCHKTNKIRGLLCNSCNRGLGYLRDSAELLRKALAYIIKGGE